MNTFNAFRVMFNSLKSIDQCSYLEFFGGNIHKIIVIYDVKKVDYNYEESEKSWLNEMKDISRHIKLKKAIMKNLSIKKYIKVKEKIKMNMICFISINLVLKPVLDHKFLVNNLFKVLCRNSTVFELFSTLNQLQNSVIEVFYTSNIENPIDFHYIINQSAYLAQVLQRYSQFILEITQTTDLQQDVFNIFINEKKALEEFKQSFDKWRNLKMKVVEDVEMKLKKRNKILGLKWEERDIFTNMQKIGKKRAGLKRQMALKEKKNRIKPNF